MVQGGNGFLLLTLAKQGADELVTACRMQVIVLVNLPAGQGQLSERIPHPLAVVFTL